MREPNSLTLFMPEEMINSVKDISEQEHKTPSELIRTLLRDYFIARLPVVKASAREMRAIERGRRDFREGHYRSVTEILNDLGQLLHKGRRKKSAKDSR